MAQPSGSAKPPRASSSSTTTTKKRAGGRNKLIDATSLVVAVLVGVLIRSYFFSPSANSVKSLLPSFSRRSTRTTTPAQAQVVEHRSFGVLESTLPPALANATTVRWDTLHCWSLPPLPVKEESVTGAETWLT